MEEVDSIYNADIFVIEHNLNDIGLQENKIYIRYYNSIEFSNIDDRSIFPYWNSVLIERPPNYKN